MNRMTLVVMGLCSLAGVVMGQQLLQPVPQESASSTGFGFALSGDQVIVGSRTSSQFGEGAGRALGFSRTGPGASWTQTSLFTKTPVTTRQFFTWSAAKTESSYIASCLPVDASGNVVAGESVSIFENVGLGNWAQRAVFTPPPAADSSLFGYRVDIATSTALFTHKNGTVYIARREDGGTWTLKHNFIVPGTGPFINGGVSIGDSTLAVAGQQGGQRRIWLYTDTGSTTPTFERDLTVPRGLVSNGSWMGAALSLHRDRWLFASDFFDDRFGTDAGIVYAFRKFRGEWRLWQEISAPNPRTGEWFGELGASRGRLVVAAQNSDRNGARSGAGFLFQQQPNGQFGVQTQLLPPTISAGDIFGSVAVDGNTVMFGSAEDDIGGFFNSGSAYAYEFPPVTGLSWVPVVGRHEQTTSTDPLPPVLFDAALDNISESSYHVTVRSADPWLEPVPGDVPSVLGSDESAEIAFRPTTAALQLGPGLHRTQIIAERQEDGAIVSVDVDLILPGPQRLSVFGPGDSEVTRGDGTPDDGDGTRLPVTRPGRTVQRTFSLRSTGGDALTIQSAQVLGAGGAEISLVNPPFPVSLNSGSEVALVVRYAPTTEQDAMVTVSLTTTEPQGSPFEFAVLGRNGINPIVVRGGAIEIPNPAASPLVANLTDFGQVDELPGISLKRTFLIQGALSRPVQITGVSLNPSNAGFQVSLDPVTLSKGTTAPLRITYAGTGVSGTGRTTVSLHLDSANVPTHEFVVQADAVRPPGTPTAPGGTAVGPSGWLELGPSDSALAETGTGSRGYDESFQALRATLFPSPFTRVVGWRETPDNDVTFNQVGTNQILRGTFDLFQTGPGSDRLNETASRAMPNVRLRVMQRFVLTSMLELSPNQINGDLEIVPFALEVAPSSNPELPSRYTVDLDPITIPALQGALGSEEGYQAGYEAIAEVTGVVPTANQIQGNVFLKSRSLSTYPDPGMGLPPIKVYQPSTGDFLGDNVRLDKFQVDRAPLAQGIVQGWTPVTPITFASGDQGLTIDTTAVGSDKTAVATLNFLNGNSFDATRPEADLRVDPQRLYKVSFLLTNLTSADRMAQIRLRARTIKFQWNQSLTMGGAKAVGSATGQTIAAQILPGIGSGNTDVDPVTGGYWYHQYVSSPLDPAIRQDVNGSLAVKFPRLSSQPGMGEPTPISFRSFRIGMDVIDSLSFAPGAETEEARLLIRKIEVRSLPQPR